MSIKDFLQKIKLFLANIKDKIYSEEKGLKIKGDLYIVIIIILVGTASYGLGKISAFEKNRAPIFILKTEEYINSNIAEAASSSFSQKTSNTEANGLVVASKTGTKYYYPWCIGASRISETNKTWFKTTEDARSAGLTPASNCTGLK